VPLRNFHLLFITLSTLLAAGLAFWSIDRFASVGGTEHAVTGVLSIGGIVALVTYGMAFRRKSREW
jgi:predicted membrane protein